MKKSLNIQYKYVKISDAQFATFEENYDPSGEIEMQNSVSFSFDYGNSIITCRELISFVQEKKIIIKVGLDSSFLLHPDTVSELTKDGVIACPKEILCQFASLNYGTIRGVLYDRTKDSELRSIILPPFFFDGLINEDAIFDKKD